MIMIMKVMWKMMMRWDDRAYMWYKKYAWENAKYKYTIALSCMCIYAFISLYY